ncbi:hypothetical protein [Sinorhizobium meliloti]|uniref:hypothetical protein n=2 Tax=Sinorhizobium TaxID=28105 RepID=UPI001F3B6712|nr:hypothetical protein [Sinorhizobium meliloti]
MNWESASSGLRRCSTSCCLPRLRLSEKGGEKMHNVRFTEKQIRLLDLASYIEQLPPDHRFDMECWLDDSYRPSCIATWALWRMLGDLPEGRKIDWLRCCPSLPEAAGQYLCVLGDDLRQLFMPLCGDIMDSPPSRSTSEATIITRHNISKEWAASTLRHLAATGKVDWKAAEREMRPATRLLPFAEMVTA